MQAEMFKKLNQMKDDMPSIIDHAGNYRMIVELMGHVENGTDRIVVIFQDDATKDYFVKVNSFSYFASTLSLALLQAYHTEIVSKLS